MKERPKRTGLNRGGLRVPSAAAHWLGPDQRERHAAPPSLSRRGRAVPGPASALPQDGRERSILFNRSGVMLTGLFILSPARGVGEHFLLSKTA